MAWGIAVLVMLVITGGVGSLCGPPSASPKPCPTIYVGGWTVGQKFLDALKITRPVLALYEARPAGECS